MQIEGTNVAGVVVAIHNVPGEGDVGAVLVGHLEVANIIGLGSSIATQKERVWEDCTMFKLPFKARYIHYAISQLVIQKAVLL